MNKALIAATLVIGLTGCATTPRLTQAELDKGNYGTLTVEEANAGIKERLSQTLIDPDSMRFRGPTKVTKHWIIDDGGSGKYHYGWLAFYAVNSKNRYGGYAGETAYAVFFENGRIVGGYEGGEGDSWPRGLNAHTMDKVIGDQ